MAFAGNMPLRLKTGFVVQSQILYKYEAKTHTVAFSPQYLEFLGCIDGGVALHHICQLYECKMMYRSGGGASVLKYFNCIIFSITN